MTLLFIKVGLFCFYSSPSLSFVHSMSLSFRPLTYLSTIYLCISYLSLSLSIHLSINHLSISMYVSMHLSIYVSNTMYVYAYGFMYVYLCVYYCVCIYVCMNVCIYLHVRYLLFPSRSLCDLVGKTRSGLFVLP